MLCFDLRLSRNSLGSSHRQPLLGSVIFEVRIRVSIGVGKWVHDRHRLDLRKLLLRVHSLGRGGISSFFLVQLVDIDSSEQTIVGVGETAVVLGPFGHLFHIVECVSKPEVRG